MSETSLRLLEEHMEKDYVRGVRVVKSTGGEVVGGEVVGGEVVEAVCNANHDEGMCSCFWLSGPLSSSEAREFAENVKKETGLGYIH